MKKLCYFLFIYIFIITLSNVIDVKAQDAQTDYQSFKEIIMSEGKLLKDYTDEMYDALYKETDQFCFIGNVVYPVSNNIKASYISNTLFSVFNDADTNVEYSFDATVETNNKLSFSVSGGLSTSNTSTIDKVKNDCSAKAGIELSIATTVSKKEKQTIKITVEPNSMAIIYLTGTLSVSNGVIAKYAFFMKSNFGGYEFVIIESQYANIEKRRF